MFRYSGIKIYWLGHDGFKIKNGLTIYIDPYMIGSDEKADLILITHEHYDYCSPEDLKKISSKETTIVAPESCKRQLSGVTMKELRTLRPGEKTEVRGVILETIPAYNINKFKAPGKPFHPREANNIGIVLTIGSVRIYHAGDTDAIPEMTGVNAEIALLPVSGTYVMTAEEAAEAASRLKPKVAIPMHYGAGIGSKADAEKFKRLAKCRVEILEKE